MQDSYGNTPLHLVLSEGSYTIQKFLKIYQEITPKDLAIQNKNLDTPFHTSIRNGHYFANLKLLHLALKDPHLLIIRNSSNQTVLELAIEVGDNTMVKKFLQIPELVNHLDNGLTVLMRIISQREDDYACQIIKTPNAIDYSVVGKFGTTLHEAVSFCASEIVNEILDLPNVEEIVNICDKSGLTPLNVALMDESTRIALSIFKKGGKFVYNELTVKRLKYSHDPIIREALRPIMSLGNKLNFDLLLKVLHYLSA